MITCIHHWQLLDFVLLQYLCSSSQVGLLMSGYKIFACHHLVYLLIQTTFKAQIPVGNDSHEMIVLIHHGNTSDMIFMHHVESILHCTASADGHWIVDHTVLGTFHDSHLACLFLYRHILMDYADTAFRAIAIAIDDSVTVSIAAVTKGTFNVMLRENLVFNSTVFGSTSE